MRDWPRILGGRRQGKRSNALSLADAPGKSLLIKRGHFYKKKHAKNSLTSKGAKVVPTFCARRYNEFMGLLSPFDYATPPQRITPKPQIIFEVDGLASFTDSKEAVLSGISIGKKVLTTVRGQI